ncbi:uncharacterized protein Gasu_08280 [Galdieria sulphuraria]|uniref:Transmembrane adaptor Erv26 n=1 Tax=Galdieria sulphuraria TaxID=130081 RepID=M2Y8B7_GALSU|nr:uncharacterized protein Gasu_08280 [Galdieria sulphuraria]EME32084.1 hypothetical protein Gasu_08280 [Galdieria sulphuraria]|eukprot:XP_005708604.1 hypothetical protein Gasu_08280 [Galdieria sulphuraria]
MISFFVLLVWLSGYVLIGFLSLSVACGLYYLAELTEEYTTTAKKVLRFFIQFNLVIHGLLWVWERFPFLYVALGVVAHLCYFELLRGFPFIELRSPIFLSCVVTFILNNVGWMRFFLNHPQLLEAYELSPVLPLFSFFAVEVWLVPLGFVTSLSVNDSVLPGSGADVPRGVGGSRFGKLSGGEWLTASGLTGKADDTLDGISTVRPKRKSLIKALTGVATDVAKKFSWNSFNNNNRKRLV